MTLSKPFTKNERQSPNHGNRGREIDGFPQIVSPNKQRAGRKLPSKKKRKTCSDVRDAVTHTKNSAASSNLIDSIFSASNHTERGHKVSTEIFSTQSNKINGHERSWPSPNSEPDNSLRHSSSSNYLLPTPDNDQETKHLLESPTSSHPSNQPSNTQSLATQLPISSAREKLRRKLTHNQVIILLGETGSGKSTQLPQFLRNISWQHGMIGITQPRRVAAINLATRVAEESGCVLGKEVGYSIRFDDHTTPLTRIKYLTDGMLLREMLSDKLLSRYSTLVLDEAHERTLLTDLILGIVRRLLCDRKDLRVVIMSATLDAKRFADFFSGAEICYIAGRLFPVATYYTRQSQSDYLDAALKTIYSIHMKQPAGDILVFLTGQDEIDGLEKSIYQYAHNLPPSYLKLLVCPLYAALPANKQQQAFNPTPPHTRKVILSTNIAETSVTISGIRYVVDCGFAKLRKYQNGLKLESLLVAPISKSSARQRAGRAGREAPGSCFRLYPESEYRKLTNETEPEILRCDVATAILTLKAIGVQNVLDFDFLDRPSNESILTALQNLYFLGALDPRGNITSLGKQISELPLSPALGRVLLAAATEHQCLGSVIDIISCLSVEQVFVTPVEKRDEAAAARSHFGGGGDHIVLRNALRAYMDTEKSKRKAWCEDAFISFRGIQNVMDVRKQITKYCNARGFKPSDGDVEAVLRSFLCGFATQTALLQADGQYQTLTGHHKSAIHPSSSIFQRKFPAIVYHESVFTTRAYARCVSPIQVSWIRESAPQIFNSQAA